jgi:hypothetical protein
MQPSLIFFPIGLLALDTKAKWLSFKLYQLMGDRMPPIDLVAKRGQLLTSVTRWLQVCHGNRRWSDLEVAFANEPGLQLILCHRKII